MGVIRFFFYLLIFLISTSLYSQDINDTIFINNHSYIKHIVKADQTIDDISELYKISVNRILETNETGMKLYKQQVLYIPIKRNKAEETISNRGKKLDIALLLPFYKNLNDTLVASFEDKDKANDVILGKSNMALQFMQGVHLALDSLERLGIAINLVVYDTRNDSAKVVEIVRSKILDTVDIIIGPIYSRNMEIVSNKYGDDNGKILISPLSKSSDFLKNNPSTIQINTPFKIQSKIITKFIEEKYNAKNIIICYEEEEKGLALYLERQLSKNTNRIMKMNMIYTHIDSIRSQFLDSQIVILPSFDRAFVSKMLATLGGIDSSFIVFGLSNLKNYDHLDIENLMHLDVHFPDPYYFNKNIRRDSLLLYSFEEKFISSPSRFSIAAYNIMMNFCNKNMIYNLEKYRLTGGKINIYAPLVRYLDYSLERAVY